MTLDELKSLMDSGDFHHAGYGNFGTLWEGLWIYRCYDGLRGFIEAGAFLKNDPNLPHAEQIVRGTGISVGSYGDG